MGYVNKFAKNYYAYLCEDYPTTEVQTIEKMEILFEATNWNSPQTGSDWNNLSVMYLIEAEFEQDFARRQELISSAMAGLERGFNIDQNLHCIAHYALVQSLLGNDQAVINLILHACLYGKPASSLSLVYLPRQSRGTQEFNHILEMEDGQKQSKLLFSEVIRRSQYIFYNGTGWRFLRLAHQLNPKGSQNLLQLAIIQMMTRQPEAVVWLEEYLEQDYTNPLAWQSLYLAYRDMGNTTKAQEYLDLAKKQSISQQIDWQWSNLTVTSDYTYLQFDDEIQITVEPSYSSIVTSVLLGSGDWFEREMEFWRDNITEGMTVIDVGANAGVYTFSAAKRVGVNGLVLAIEPFSKCVSYLLETCRVNKMDWVKICAGAASDREGKAKLSLSSSSELNEIVRDENQVKSGNYEEVNCFTLDSLINKYNLKKVDFLKIDAEGHELQVLGGSERLISEFKPIILYENIAGAQGSNFPVADYLRSIDYQLFRYQPYLKNLIPLALNSDIVDNLNIIALPQ